MRTKRRHVLMIRVHEGEFAGLKAVAISRGLSVSDHVRKMLGFPSRASASSQPAAAQADPNLGETPGGMKDTLG